MDDKGEWRTRLTWSSPPSPVSRREGPRSGDISISHQSSSRRLVDLFIGFIPGEWASSFPGNGPVHRE